MREYDFIAEVIKAQEKKGYTDKEVSDRTGIPECIYYDMKKYRTYVTKVAYYSICVVLEIDIYEEDLDKIIENNKYKVGDPDTNLKLAVRVANPEYVRKLEKEIAVLQKLKDRLDSMQELLIVLKKENRDLRDLVEQSSKEDKEKEREIYQKVARELGSKSNRALSESIEREYREAIEALNDKIAKRDIEILKHNLLYYDFYMSVLKEKGKKPEGYPIPKTATVEEINQINNMK